MYTNSEPYIPEASIYIDYVSSTFAGNLTIMGSVANRIVMELSKEHAHVGFWDFFKVGFYNDSNFYHYWNSYFNSLIKNTI